MEHGGCLRTFARFFRHSVQAFGVTTPRPRRRFEFCELLAPVGGPEPADGVFEDWAEVGVGLPWDAAPEAPACDAEATCGVFPELEC